MSDCTFVALRLSGFMSLYHLSKYGNFTKSDDIDALNNTPNINSLALTTTTF